MATTGSRLEAVLRAGMARLEVSTGGAGALLQNKLKARQERIEEDAQAQHLASLQEAASRAYDVTFEATSRNVAKVWGAASKRTRAAWEKQGLTEWVDPATAAQKVYELILSDQEDAAKVLQREYFRQSLEPPRAKAEEKLGMVPVLEAHEYKSDSEEPYYLSDGNTELQESEGETSPAHPMLTAPPQYPSVTLRPPLQYSRVTVKPPRQDAARRTPARARQGPAAYEPDFGSAKHASVVYRRGPVVEE